MAGLEGECAGGPGLRDFKSDGIDDDAAAASSRQVIRVHRVRQRRGTLTTRLTDDVDPRRIRRHTPGAVPIGFDRNRAGAA
jgi:hypothetical protein